MGCIALARFTPTHTLKVPRIGMGVKTYGWHARSALGFVSLPTGVAVEMEAIFEIKE